MTVICQRCCDKRAFKGYKLYYSAKSRICYYDQGTSDQVLSPMLDTGNSMRKLIEDHKSTTASTLDLSTLEYLVGYNKSALIKTKLFLPYTYRPELETASILFSIM